MTNEVTNEVMAFELIQESEYLSNDFGKAFFDCEMAEKMLLRMAEWKDAQLAKLKKAWEKEAEINHDAEMAYKQGRHDAIEELLQYLEELETHYRDLGQYDDGKPIRRVIEYIKAMEEEA